MLKLTSPTLEVASVASIACVIRLGWTFWNLLSAVCLYEWSLWLSLLPFFKPQYFLPSKSHITDYRTLKKCSSLLNNTADVKRIHIELAGRGPVLHMAKTRPCRSLSYLCGPAIFNIITLMAALCINNTNQVASIKYKIIHNYCGK